MLQESLMGRGQDTGVGLNKTSTVAMRKFKAKSPARKGLARVYDPHIELLFSIYFP